MRIHKYISLAANYSRRKIDKLIKSQKVTINGEICTHGALVNREDIVFIDGKPIELIQEDLIYIKLNKPQGVTCTAKKNIKGNIIDFVGHSSHIFPIGRLDKASEGLILLTNDGDIVNKILRSENNHEKEYIVSVNKPITDWFLKGMAEGVPILGTITKPCIVKQINDYVFSIILTQGLNRQIRRMCRYFDYTVERLERIRIMNITLEGLESGQWCELTEYEIIELQKQL